MAVFRYLSPAHLQGFNMYKYKSIDTSPLSKYVMQPFWNGLVKLLPMWVAPNFLTLSGWLLLLVNFALLSYYDWDYKTTTNDEGLNRPPIPAAVWLFCGISHFVSHTLDGMDGKQARRTGSSTPLGELFDHGCDSWAAILLPLCLLSGFGRGTAWGGSPHHAYVPCVAVVAGFYLSHWEKYITGALYLPWLYDAMQLACAAAYVVTGIYGVQFWHFYMFPNWTCAYVVKWLLISTFLGCIPMSLWNIYDHYTQSNTEDSLQIRQTQDHQPQQQAQQQQLKTQQGSPSPVHRRLGFAQAMAPWLPFVLMCIPYTAWVYLSPTDIMERDPRMFLFSIGLISSNIVCRLIISQMSGQPCELFNYLLIPLSLAVVISLVQPQYELVILYSYTAVLLLAHLHYGVSIVYELCEHFHIYAFSLGKKDPTS